MFMFHHHNRLVEMYICVYTIFVFAFVCVCSYIQLQHFYASKSRNKQPTCFELILNNMQVKFLVPGERQPALFHQNTINNTAFSTDFTYASFFIFKSIDACIRSDILIRLTAFSLFIRSVFVVENVSVESIAEHLSTDLYFHNWQMRVKMRNFCFLFRLSKCCN